MLNRCRSSFTRALSSAVIVENKNPLSARCVSRVSPLQGETKREALPGPLFKREEMWQHRYIRVDIALTTANGVKRVTSGADAGQRL